MFLPLSIVLCMKKEFLEKEITRQGGGTAG